MSKNIIVNVVIILGIFIIVAFLAVIYGMYSKISNSVDYSSDSPYFFSSFLSKNENIKNIEVIDNNKLLILIENDENLKGAIYDINNNKIIGYIQR